MSKYNNNASDADDVPPPAYQEVATPPFNPNFVSHAHSPPHTPELHYQHHPPEGSQTLYPQIPTSTPVFPQPHHYTSPPQQPIAPHMYSPSPQPQRYQPRYQTIDIPYTANVNTRRTHDRKFPLAAIFFLFGWFCPPLWVIGACCCAGSRNPYEAFWGKANFIMAMALIVSSIVYSAFAMSEYMA
ncbi:hypothetical protein INT47_005609 [Mucor saturninus]|uniref:Uncharacterized protein n=1 Tax=Mucor saturninus TaxID=64648 RepID=A0A8H7UYC8_9FUNG|nr:hypothetical protein INT47_005609 [Mucor saturninus]